MAGLGLGLSLGRSGRRRRGPAFSPLQVPEVAAGYFWDPQAATGLGTAGFKIPEGNGQSSFDILQTDPTKQVSALSSNGVTLYRTNPPTSFQCTAGAIQAGWTGATGILGWFRLPNAAGAIAATDLFFSHTLSTGNQRRFSLSTAFSNQTIRTNTCTDAGATSLQQQFPNVLAGAGLHFLEAYFDPLFVLGGSLATDRCKLFCDLVQIVPSTAISAGTALFNGSAQLALAGNIAGTAADVLDFGLICYTNGIASLANRVKVANFRNPTGILLAA